MFNFDIINFLNPYTEKLEILPIIFFSIIAFLFLFSWINLILNAKIENWAKNWEKRDLDIVQGSISELSDGIATKSEKIATAMPGIILIIGLLGTFIGLGLALDKASIILSSADMNNIDNSMGQLMGMMEGLGTKFKTSTWGLIAFLLLKALSSKNNFEERRLSWVSNKIRDNLNKRNLIIQKQNEEKINLVIESIDKLKTNLLETQDNNISSRKTLINSIKEESLDNIIQNLKNVAKLNQDQIETINNGFQKTQEETLKLHNRMISSIENTFAKIINETNEKHSNLLSSLNRKQLDLFVKHHNESAEITNTMSENLSRTFSQAIQALKEQQSEHSDLNKNNMHNLAQRICESIETQQSRIIEAVDKNSHYLDITAKESQQTREAMDKFVNESLKTIENLKQSASGMSQAANDIGSSASQLQNVIDSLSLEMRALLATMRSDLGETIKNMDQSFVSNMSKMSNNLSQTISDMSDNFKKNMTEMSDQLGIATQDISTAVTNLSSSVDNTMTNVSETIEKSMDLQKKAQVKFVETSDNLNEKIITMTTLVEKLTDDIINGLDAISSNNRKIISLDKRYNSSSDKVEDLIKVVEHTQSNGKQVIELLDHINNSLKNNSQSLIDKILGFSTQLEAILDNIFAIQHAIKEQQSHFGKERSLHEK